MKMVKTIINAYPKEKRITRNDGSPILNISECFCSIQGENFTGYPSVFLRLQGCSIFCQYCDSSEVWRQGNPYSVKELLEMWEKEGVIDRLKNGHHLVITGGSPLLQQDNLQELIIKLAMDYDCKPFVEVENECTIMPNIYLFSRIDRWNNSPKLTNSNVKMNLRYKPEILKRLDRIEDSWFKFVVSKEEDWNEIKEYFINPGYINKEKIVLMPEGKSREELQSKYEWLVELCCREGVKMTGRMQIEIWNKTVGV